MTALRALSALLLSLGAACGGSAPPCEVEVREVPHRLGVHFPQGTPLSWESNPPATGPHYDVWAPWARIYEQPVPRGNYVHNLEHGGVVLLHRDPGDPAAERLAALGRSLQDASCTPPINARWLVTPDPLLPPGRPVAAAAWGHIYTAACLDEPSLAAFVAARYGRADEDTCADGRIVW